MPHHRPGPGRPDPAAGYQPRPTAARAGAGLWLARQACDELDMWRTGRTFTVRLATRTTPEATRQTAGARARAETARARAETAPARASLTTRRLAASAGHCPPER